MLSLSCITSMSWALTYVYGNMPGGVEPLLVWMTINSDITSSLDWNAYSHPMDLATVSTNAPNQASCTIASSNEFPFYLDSGATTHLLPSHEDFFTLWPIASHPIKGVGGTSIFATSIGEICLHIAHSAWIILLDILFIPTAMVCLISVSAIARDSKIISHFDNASCWLTSKSTGTIIARGTLLPKTCLYSLPHKLITHTPFIALLISKPGTATLATLTTKALPAWLTKARSMVCHPYLPTPKCLNASLVSSENRPRPSY